MKALRREITWAVKDWTKKPDQHQSPSIDTTNTIMRGHERFCESDMFVLLGLLIQSFTSYPFRAPVVLPDDRDSVVR